MAAVAAAPDEEALSLLQGDPAEAPAGEPAVLGLTVEMVEPKKLEVSTLVRGGDFAEAGKLLERSPEMWLEVDAEGHTVLHWSSLAGNMEFVEKSLAAGVKVDARSNNGQTPFMWAAIRGHIDVAKMLLQAGAEPRAQDSLGATAMILAVQYRHHSFFLLLLTRAPPAKLLSDADSKGCTPLHWAAYKGEIASLRLCIYFEANFKAVDNEGMTPLHRAVQCQAGRDVFQLLVDNEVNPLVRDSEGRTCLTIAVDNKDISTAYILRKILQKAGFNTDDLEKKSPEGVMLGASEVEDIEVGEHRPSAKDTRKAKEKKDKDFVKDIQGKAVQYMAPTFWLVSVSLAVFQYLTDMRSIAWEFAPWISLGFELGVPLSLALFFFTALSDPGKVPAAIKSASGVEDLMRALDTAAIGSGDKLVDACGRRLNFGRLCTTTWILKGLRTKYCTQTGACVAEFDHFCGWLNTAIGRGNHRPFIALATMEVSCQMCHLYLLVQVALRVVTYERLGQWLSSLIISYPLLCVMMVLQGFTTPGIMCLLSQHLRMIAVNMTTNEMINYHRYEHFWEIRDIHGAIVPMSMAQNGQQKVFVNPFDKGSVARNCLDFWWDRRRGEERSQLMIGHKGNL